MGNLGLTILIAILVMGLVISGLAIGLILTGRSRLRRGCGMTPSKKNQDEPSCPICGDEEECKKDDNDADTKE